MDSSTGMVGWASAHERHHRIIFGSVGGPLALEVVPPMGGIFPHGTSHGVAGSRQARPFEVL